MCRAGLVDLELLCQYDNSRDIAQLLAFLDDSVDEDRHLKMWIHAHRAAFDPDAVPREDAVGAWVMDETETQRSAGMSETAYQEHLTSLLLQQGLQLCDSLLALPLATQVRKARHELARICQAPSPGTAGDADGATESVSTNLGKDSKDSRAALRDASLSLEAALVDSQMLSPAWTEAGKNSMHKGAWRAAFVQAREVNDDVHGVTDVVVYDLQAVRAPHGVELQPVLTQRRRRDCNLFPSVRVC